MSERIDFGCDFCANEQNRFYGHVTQIASDGRRRVILLRCPGCGALYENRPRGPDRTRRLTTDEAEHLFVGLDLHLSDDISDPSTGDITGR